MKRDKVKYCEGCGKPFEVKRKESKYCSSSCFGIHNVLARENLTSPKIGTPNKSKGKLRPCVQGENHPMFGKKHTIKSILKIKEKRKLQGRVNVGEKHWNWKGGVSDLRERINNCFKNIEWRNLIFKRDNYTCCECGQYGGRLQVHHNKMFSLIMKENNIKTVEDAILCKELWNLSNGKTLCETCHKETDSYGGKAHKFLNEKKKQCLI